MASSFAEHAAMGPEYYVSHVFHSTDAVRNELPLLLQGQDIKPSSGLGSNASSSESVAPRAVVVGAGFSRSELDEMRLFPGCKDLPWLYPAGYKMAQTGLGALFGKDFMTSIIERSKATMKENDLVEGKEQKVKPDVWDF
ncbi:hypothetical protein MBLNU13_g04332t1 [Cladosporium sp. NU13]